MNKYIDPKDGQQEETQEQAAEATQATEEKAAEELTEAKAEGQGALVD